MIDQKFQNNFRMYFNNNMDKYRSIAFGYSSNMILSNSSDCCSKSVLALKKPTIFRRISESCTPNLLPNLFLENLTNRIDEEKPDVLLRDFNLDALCYDSFTPLQHYNRHWKIMSYWFLNPLIWMEVCLIMFTLQSHFLLTKYQLQ